MASVKHLRNDAITGRHAGGNAHGGVNNHLKLDAITGRHAGGAAHNGIGTMNGYRMNGNVSYNSGSSGPSCNRCRCCG